jgi:hypothetical protein
MVKKWSKLAVILFIITAIFFIMFVSTIINNFFVSPSLKKGGDTFLTPLSYVFRIPLLFYILPIVLGVLNVLALVKCSGNSGLKGKTLSILGIAFMVIIYITSFILTIIGLSAPY